MIADKMTEEFADVAQLVEQLIRNQQVNGSSPFVGSMHSVIQQRMESAPNGRVSFHGCDRFDGHTFFAHLSFSFCSRSFVPPA